MQEPRWQRLEAGLGPADAREAAGDARVGAALALLCDVVDDDDVELVLTKRREDLRTHPGQISFPGGRVDAGESVEQAAVREAVEEVGLDSSTVSLLGALPAFYVAPSRYWLQTVVARWHRPHALRAAEHEVAEILRVRVSALCDASSWRAVMMSRHGPSWAWQLEGGHLLWGATGRATAQLLDLLAPSWHGGRAPADLGQSQEVRPWTMSRPSATRLACLDADASEPAESFGPGWQGEPEDAHLDAIATAAARSVRALGAGSVAVLLGGGGNGLAGAAAARRLAGLGVRVEAVLDRPAQALSPRAQRLLAGVEAYEFRGELPRPAVFVDALVGGGLDGPLRAPAQHVVEALQQRAAPVLSLDVPTGTHRMHGIVGPSVSARASLAFGGVPAGFRAPGVEPFVGDLCVVDEQGRVTRVVHEPRAGWRE